MKILTIVCLAAGIVAPFASAHQPVILSFEADGSLAWSNAYSDTITSVERLTDVPTTGSAVTATATLGVSDGSTSAYSYTVDHPPIINPSVTINDGTYSWNDVTGPSTNPPALIGWIDYQAGTVYASYLSQVPAAGTPIEVAYSFLPVTLYREWLSAHIHNPTSQVSELVVDMSEDTSLFRVAHALSPMALIPGGSNSGTNPLARGEIYYPCQYLETYSLSVGSFYMDRYEVTNDEMVRVMQWAYDHGRISVSSTTVHNAQGVQQELLGGLPADGESRITWDGSSFGMKAVKGSGYPCVEVTWYGAACYCNYRSEMEGLTPCYNLTDWSCNVSAGGYRLPTSEEWEYAARGGLVSKRFPWGDTISHSQANYHGESDSYDLSSGYHPVWSAQSPLAFAPVGSFSANDYGLFDMVGNAFEWCDDWDPCYVGERRVMRGGNAYSGGFWCRIGRLRSVSPSRGDFLGFRTARSVRRQGESQGGTFVCNSAALSHAGCCLGHLPASWRPSLRRRIGRYISRAASGGHAGLFECV